MFSLWLHLFILSGVISPLFSSSILCSYWPREFIFQCHILLPFHTVHGVLKARILKWFAIPFSSGPHFVRTLHHDMSQDGCVNALVELKKILNIYKKDLHFYLFWLHPFAPSSFEDNIPRYQFRFLLSHSTKWTLFSKICGFIFWHVCSSLKD